jgi:NodT family efflux transporter outer membrane factor (OMF) lipoprotein
LRNGLKVGPNYSAPPVALAAQWLDANDKRVRQASDELSQWWRVFDDPVLDELIVNAYQQNLTLREAGFRVLQARANLGIVRGEIFPQAQFGFGAFDRSANSLERGGGISVFRQRYFSRWTTGFSLAWELDFWGRYRRQIESAGAVLDASVHEYDAVLVTLLADVATNYVIYRTTEDRIRYALENVKIQEESARVAEAREAVVKGKQDSFQAQALLFQTRAAIPELEIDLRQSMNRLSILLGTPPEDLSARLRSAKARIPSAPADIAIGIPADLLRRRPDVRRAERLTAAQSAQIGVAESEFYPHIVLNGTLSFAAEQFKDLFKGSAFNGSFGPSFQWNLLNYGRIRNNVLLQDARFQELLTAYQNSVLNAQMEVEDGLITFLNAQKRARLQAESADFAKKAEPIVRKRYEVDQAPDFTRVTQTQQLRVQELDLLAQAQGEIALGLIQVYRALGGGWQIRLVSPAELAPRPTLRFGRPH